MFAGRLSTLLSSPTYTLTDDAVVPRSPRVITGGKLSPQSQVVKSANWPSECACPAGAARITGSNPPPVLLNVTPWAAYWFVTTVPGSWSSKLTTAVAAFAGAAAPKAPTTTNRV